MIKDVYVLRLNS